MRLEFEPNALTQTLNTAVFFDDNVDVAQAQDFLRSGIKAAQASNRAEARRLLMRAAEIDPRNETAWFWLASTSEYPEELLFFLNSVLDINPDNARAHEWLKATKSLLASNFVQRGIEAVNAEQKDFAKQCFFQAADYDAKNELAWLWLAFVSEPHEEKRAHLEKVLSVNPENEDARKALNDVYQAMARNLFDKACEICADDPAAALALLEESLRKAPNLVAAWLLKAELTGDFKEKIKCFEKVIEMEPAHETANAGLQSLYALTIAPQTAEFPAEDLEVFTIEQNEYHEELFTHGQAGSENIEENFACADALSENGEVSTEAENKNRLFAAGETIFTKESESEEEFVFAGAVEIQEETFTVAPPETPQTEFEIEGEGAKNIRAENESGVFSFDDSETIFTVKESYPENESGSFEAAAENGFSILPLEPSAPGADSAEEKVENRKYFQFENAVSDEYKIADEYNIAESESGQNIETSLETYSEEDVFAVNGLPATNLFAQPVDGSSVNNSYKENNMLEVENYQTTNNFSNNADLNDEILIEETDLLEVEDYPLDSGEPLEFPEEPILNISRKFHSDAVDCPFCSAENDTQAFVCRQCRAVLSLSDLELILANQYPDRELIGRTVERMEFTGKTRNFSHRELVDLGIGHLNLKNFRQGFSYLQQASQANPNDVLLSSQVNALAIRVEEIERKEEAQDTQLKGRKILVVDDSATVRKLISGKLEKSGHEVVCAFDGMDALAKLNEISPDLILLDINMPRMDGYQVCKLIRNNPLTKDIPVVMISGKDGFFDKVRGRMAGSTGYITKPFGPETLMKALDVYIKNGVNAFSEEEQTVPVEA
jgi:twitching motility two-component system response regulator PilG